MNGGKKMNQKKIGSFLKELRKQKGITQEKFAEKLNVSGRTVSRWETGINLPDISLLVEIADFFDVSIPEIIRGERKSATMENDVKKVAESMSDYAATEKLVLLKRVKLVSIIGLISIVTGLIMESIHHESMIPVYECVKGICLGLGVGALVTMVLYTTGILVEIKRKKNKYMKKIAIFCFVIMMICIIVSSVLSIS
jgi:transcriptional regulator with XRE-family HTH domain